MAEDGPDGAMRELVDRLSDGVSLAVAQERVRRLEEMVEQLKAERDRYAGLLEDLRTRRLVVEGTERQRLWWRFW